MGERIVTALGPVNYRVSLEPIFAVVDLSLRDGRSEDQVRQ